MYEVLQLFSEKANTRKRRNYELHVHVYNAFVHLKMLYILVAPLFVCSAAARSCMKRQGE